MTKPTLPAPTELVIVRPGSPETAGTRYLGLAEALDRLRGAQLRGKVTARHWTLAEREAGLDAAAHRALLVCAEKGFGWRPREGSPRAAVRSDDALTSPVRANKPRVRLNLTFADILPVVVGNLTTTTGSGVSKRHT